MAAADTDTDGFERILESSGPGERTDEDVILTAIVGDNSVSVEAETTTGTRSSVEMERLRRDGREAEMEGGIVVRRDLKQHVVQVV